MRFLLLCRFTVVLFPLSSLPQTSVFPGDVLATELEGEDEDGGLFDGDDDDGWAAIALEEEQADKDFALLEYSHLSLLDTWVGFPSTGKQPEVTWFRPFRPLRVAGRSLPGKEPIHTYVAIPEAGTYRLYLRHVLEGRITRPVRLSITPQKVTALPAGGEGDGAVGEGAEQGFSFQDSGDPLSHTYGDIRFPAATAGRTIEKRLSIRFESELQRVGYHSGPLMVWEFWDVDLTKGSYKVALQSDNKQARVGALFISQSKDFRPSFTTYPEESTLNRVYLRFRVVEGAVEGDTYGAIANLTYHWRGRADVWGHRLGSMENAPAKGWSPFLEGTEALVPGPGPWSTCRLTFSGLRKGKVEIQVAWYPHEGAVQHTATVNVAGQKAMLRLPHGAPRTQGSRTAAVWGMLPAKYLKMIQPEAEVVEKYFAWAREAEEKIGLGPAHPRPHHIKITTSCGLGEANFDRGCEMLARLGVNWIPGASEAVREKYGLINGLCGYNSPDAKASAIKSGLLSEEDRALYLTHKVGDEILTRIPETEINGNMVLRQQFHAYLEAQAQAAGMDNQTFLGMKRFDRLDAIRVLPDFSGRYERRLFYASQRFKHILLIKYYRKVTNEFLELFPNVQVYNNYSPHTVFLTGATMNLSDWFILCRNQAQTLGWAEDWAYAGGKSLGTFYQCTSFYAALVECGARKHGYESGFYVGVNCLGGARKIFSCVGQGLTVLNLYDWGPIDSVADGINSWSFLKSQYLAVLTATCALGPADTIIGKGKREARRTAILYNRSHEIWQGGTGRMNHDWMWTYIGLRSAQIPVDVIIEEDLTPEELKQYKVIYVGGFNLAGKHLTALEGWVAEGGLLVGTAGAAHRDTTNDRQAAAVKLFGASQKRVPVPPQKPGQSAPPPPVVRFTGNDLVPAVSFEAEGLQFRLQAEGADVVGRYQDGSAAAVLRPAGKGKVLLFGLQLGFAYRRAERWIKGTPPGHVRQWLVAPALKWLGRPMAEYSDPNSETTVFTHETGIAVLLNSFSRQAPPASSHLSVKPGRPIKEVVSALNGKVEWQEKEGRIEIGVPQLNPVDVIILR